MTSILRPGGDYRPQSDTKVAALARRLWSCPECGLRWVSEGLLPRIAIVGVRGRLNGDPIGTKLVCLGCHCAVDAHGKPTGFARK